MATSYISKQEVPAGEAVAGKDIREGIFALIQAEHPGFTRELVISIEELNKYRRQYLTRLIEQEKGE
ncbi:hypothetical protein [Telluribacter humicola]|uniref:hypothetical protein n=1 Tax=Telluribacter humicola TaxID=1720261 RepID=UPI001E419EFD|nr:hypothetical protein [Telluribacter humicola]